MIKLENVGKIYNSNGNIAVGIRKVNLEFNIGEFVAITGESGSGKSTLLNVISGIDTYEEGEMYINGEETSYYDVTDLEDYRNKYVGFIFQNYNIIDSYTVLENVEASLIFNVVEKKERRKKALELIDRVGLSKKTNVKASKLSGGEKQRVVIARALAKDPLIIAADEPTGNLDSDSSKDVIKLLHEISKDKLVLVVTHDFEDVKDYATREIRIFDGEVQEDKNLKEITVSSEKTIDNDYEEKKLKSKELISFALKDLFASPKRFIFYFIVLFLFILYNFVYICVVSYELSDIDRSDVYAEFYNQDPYRIVINKKDKTPFSEEDINALKNINDVKDVIKSDFLLDSSTYGFFKCIENENYDFYVSGYRMPASLLNESDLACGRLPKESGEFVITISNEFNDGFKDFESFLNKKLVINSYNDSLFDNFTCVGVVNGQNNSKDEVDYLYLFEEDIKSEAFYSYLLMNCFSIDVTRPDSYTDSYTYFESIEESSDLAPNEFYSPYIYNTSKINEAKIEFKDAYGSLITIDPVFKDMPSYSTGSLYLGHDLYSEVINSIKGRVYDAPYQVTVYASNASRVEKIASKLSDKYIVVIPSLFENHSFDLSGVFKGLIFISICFTTAEEFLFLFLIFLHSMKSKKKDIEILRTVGATHRTVKRMIRFQLMSIGIVVYSICLITVLILKSVANGIFKMFLNTFTVSSLLLLFALVIILTYLLSSVFTRILFKKSVKKALDER